MFRGCPSENVQSVTERWGLSFQLEFITEDGTLDEDSRILICMRLLVDGGELRSESQWTLTCKWQRKQTPAKDTDKKQAKL